MICIGLSWHQNKPHHLFYRGTAHLMIVALDVELLVVGVVLFV